MNSTCIHTSRYFLLPFFLLISFHSLKAQCSSQGPLSGSSFADDNSTGVFDFNFTSNAQASDNNRATASALAILFNGSTHYLTATSFGFSIPSTAIICGIKAEVEKSATGITIFATVTDNIVRLVKGGTIVGSDYATSANWTGSDSYSTYGGTSDKWGTTWTPADINSSDFGLAFSAQLNGLAGVLPTARIDHIRITVYYVIPVPVHFIDFSTTLQKNKEVLIKWSTADNDENVDFDVQRSKDGYEWETISSQESKIAPGTQLYSYTDDITNSSNKKYYYRVKMTLRSGKTFFTNVSGVLISENQDLKLYPNPSYEYLIVNVDGVPVVNVYTMRGLKLFIPWERANSEKIKINITNLKSGNYILQVNNKSTVFTVQ